MNRLPLAFFSAATLCALAGMAMGLFMGASNDHTLRGAHAHLNLVGWASLALMGTFYALSGRSDRLGWLNWAVSTAAVAIMIPALCLVLLGNQAFGPVLVGAAWMALAGMAIFAFVVLTTWRSKPAA